ncbi:MAG: hypothetical protein HGA78_11630 [Nitrospirales bacterium]|nr:hypothetical protein [Nitrospirales bacterium]
MVSVVSVEPNLWPSSALLDWMQILTRIPSIPQRETRLSEAETILRSRMNLQGTVMGLSTERTDDLWWLMSTPDTNAVRSLLAAIPLAQWKADIPRIANGVIGRMRQGHWDTTTANAWGVLAMERFSRAFEQTPVTGSSSVSLGSQSGTCDWGKTGSGKEISLSWPEKKASVAITHQGTGRPWATIQSKSAIPLKEPFSSGYSITKRLTPVEQKTKGRWTKGDVVRVRLEIQAQAEMTWVALTDPIPSGATILGGGLRRGSLLAETEKEEGWAYEAFRERSLEAFRAYYAFVPKGGWTVEYTMRLNNDGRFNLPETRVEALYAPEMFGEIPNSLMEVLP